MKEIKKQNNRNGLTETDVESVFTDVVQAICYEHKELIESC